MKLLKVTCSGAYRHQKELVDFKEVITIPQCPEEYLKANIIKRALKKLFEEKEGAKRFDANYTCYIDKVEEIDGKLTFDGKNIEDLEHWEVQEAAIYYGLVKVPLYKSTDLRETKRVLYQQYSNEVLGEDLSDDFDFANANSIILTVSEEDADNEAIKAEKAKKKVELEAKKKAESEIKAKKKAEPETGADAERAINDAWEE